MVIELSNIRDEINLELTPEETKALNKVKKWSGIVNKAELLINKKHVYDDIDIFAGLSTSLDVCKSLVEIDCVYKLKAELDKINKFQSKV